MLWVTLAVWLVLLVLAGLVLFAIGRSVYRKGKGLAGEIGRATERLSAVTDGLQTLAERAAPAEPAVFSDPAVVRQEQKAAARGRAKARGRRSPRRTAAHTAGARSIRSGAPRR